MLNQRESKLLSILMTVLVVLAVLTGSIAVLILWRPFYYAHIAPLRIDLQTALTESQIRETYNEVMDYCLGLTDAFQLTHMGWSAEGASHFADVQRLFLLDIKVTAAAAIGLIILWGVSRYKHLQPAPIKGHNPGFWAATGLAAAFALLGALAAIDFDRFFTLFHTVFFPGRDNWIFDPQTDPVINMLPQVFFRNCAILVFGLNLVTCILLILADRRNKK